MFVISLRTDVAIVL